MFFVATADMDGKVNVSPKGLDSLYIKDSDTLYWLNLIGSGNETAAHILNNNRMTLMFCSFDYKPLILRLYGQAQNLDKQRPEYLSLLEVFPNYTGVRQIFKLNIDVVLTSCGFGVPLYKYKGQRNTLVDWHNAKDEEALITYQQKNNVKSLDGKLTDIKEQ